KADAEADETGNTPEPIKPSPPAFEALAESRNLELHTTPPLTAVDLMDTPLGTATVESFDTSFAASVTFTQHAFLRRSRPYEPVIASDDDGNRYLAWRISEEKERVPELEEVRDEVIHAWKLIK